MTSPFRLEAVRLRGIGPFDDTLIHFKPMALAASGQGKAEIHVLTGPNGCGKSTLLYALAEVFDDQESQDSMIRRRFHHDKSQVDFEFAGEAGTYGSNIPPKFHELGSNQFGDFRWLRAEEGGINRYAFGYGKILFDYSEEEQRRRHEANDTTWTNRLWHYKNIYRTPQSNIQDKFVFSAFAYSGQRSVRNEPLTAIQEINNSPFEDALSFDKTSRPKVLLQWIANNRAQSALAKADNDLAAAAAYDLALSRITGLIKDICDMEVEFRLQRSPLAVTLRVNGDTIQFDGLPDGLKSIISWVADLSLRLEAIPWEVEQDVFAQPVILFLDEVDIHLHPRWQRRILPAIQKLLPNSQVFVSTHSPFVVGSVEDAWVYRLPEPGTVGPVEVEGIPSGAGKSYRLILDEIFGIDKEFDVETEALFDRFYQARSAFLSNPGNADELRTIGGELAKRGEEASAIISRELRQISRMTGVEVGLA